MIESGASPPPPEYRGEALAAKCLFAFAGIILPIVAFACAAPQGNWAADRPWQTQEFWVYATLMLKWPNVWPFYPLLALSMTAMGLFLKDRAKYAQYTAVRIGLYGGVILALVFCRLIYSLTSDPVQAFIVTIGVACLILLATLVAVLIAWVFLGALAHSFGWRGVAWGIGIPLGFVVLISLLNGDYTFDGLLAGVFISFALSLAASPAWTCAVYAIASVNAYGLARREQKGWSLASLMTLISWFVALFGAWRKAMDLAIVEYASLPTENPNCFVCSAAACGHSCFVGSRQILVDGSRVVWVNGQMQSLKALELVVQACTPRLHRLLRRLYNVVGPRVARRRNSKWRADLAYLALKPCEWIARCGLTMLGIRAEQIACLYAPACDKAQKHPAADTIPR
jgi:hypothetical protein